MEELILLELERGWSSPSETIALPSQSSLPEEAMPDSEEMTLLDLMEFCSDVCLRHPLTILEILHEHCAESQSESCVAPLMAEIMSLRLSPFGRRLRLIH